MKTFIMTTAFAALLCPAALADDTQSKSSAGYEAELIIDFDSRDENISTREYSVTADGGRKDSRDDVYEEALLLAAKKTQREGYEWFRVTDRETDKDTVRGDRSSSRANAGVERVPVKRCGLLGCTTEYRTTYRGGFDDGFPVRDKTVYSVTLDFEMGTGPIERGGRVYHAQNIIRTH